MSHYPEPAFHFNGPISKRKHEQEYADTEAWYEKRYGEPMRGITERGREQQRQHIADSKERLAAIRKAPIAGGKNFDFVCWGDFTELKIWEKR